MVFKKQVLCLSDIYWSLALSIFKWKGYRLSQIWAAWVSNQRPAKLYFETRGYICKYVFAIKITQSFRQSGILLIAISTRAVREPGRNNDCGCLSQKVWRHTLYDLHCNVCSHHESAMIILATTSDPWIRVPCRVRWQDQVPHSYPLTIDGRQLWLEPWIKVGIVVRLDDNGERSCREVSGLLKVFVDIVILFNTIQCACDLLINLISSWKMFQLKVWTCIR
jgi:hypothetical protein